MSEAALRALILRTSEHPEDAEAEASLKALLHAVAPPPELDEDTQNAIEEQTRFLVAAAVRRQIYLPPTGLPAKIREHLFRQYQEITRAMSRNREEQTWGG